jgi:hypothetical protein
MDGQGLGELGGFYGFEYNMTSLLVPIGTTGWQVGQAHPNGCSSGRAQTTLWVIAAIIFKQSLNIGAKNALATGGKIQISSGRCKKAESRND